MDRAMASGLKIAYVDPHMGTAAATPQLREVMERVARKYDVGISDLLRRALQLHLGDRTARRSRSFSSARRRRRPIGPTLVEVHVAERTPEMDAIVDMNAEEQNAPGAGVVDHRKAELETMLSPELAALSKSGKIKLLTYQQLIAKQGGLSAMHRPAPERPTP